MQFTTVDASPQLVPSKRDPLVPVHSTSVEEREAKRPRTAEVLLEEQLPQSLIDAVELTKETIKSEEEEQLPQGITETEEEKQKHWFVGSIDQGTTSTRFLIFNGHGEPVASHQIEFENHYPHSG